MSNEIKELEQKAINFLQEKGSNYQEGSIMYAGIKENVEHPDRGTEDMHLICFALVNENSSEGQVCFIEISVETNKIRTFRTPHFSEDIYED